MKYFSKAGEALTWTYQHETVRIEAWGPDGLRVRAGMQGILDGLPGALLDEQPAGATLEVTLGEELSVISNGKIRAEINAKGEITFCHAISGDLLLTEASPHAIHPPARWFRPQTGSASYQLAVSFQPQDGERLYGLGQHPYGRLDQKGCVIDLMQSNTQVCIPFVLSSLGYGFLWNHPGTGRVELAENGMRWTADAAQQMDYYITTGDKPASILERYTAVVGRAPVLPSWAAGFWQSRLRYSSQAEVLKVAHEYHQRGLPLDIIVIDAGYWPEMGTYAFEPVQWPDPQRMVNELASLGTRVMVSVWPTINRVSPAYAEMQERGLLTRSERGNPAHIVHLPDIRPKDAPPLLTFYDPTHPQGRAFYWEILHQGLYSQGIKLFWLDACEPELIPMDYDSVRYHLGSGPEVGMLYPLKHQQALYEGLSRAGETEIVTLSRSAWAGSQRYAAAVWSGDIPSTFDSLRRQIPAGLNIGLSGIVWWTTDIGGFVGGDVNDPEFRELIVRWFQYGVFCPLFRLHGFRNPTPENWMEGGAPNEVWSFGEPAYTILSSLLHLRQRLKPYILAQMEIASQSGLPVMRPLFVDFSEDAASWTVEDAFLFGPDLLVAPITAYGQRERPVYLPAGAEWVNAWNGERFAGGQTIQVSAPLERIPVFWRAGSSWAFEF
jgi:alpha-D-xyloside xylohydrolase